MNSGMRIFNSFFSAAPLFADRLRFYWREELTQKPVIEKLPHRAKDQQFNNGEENEKLFLSFTLLQFLRQ